MEWTIIHFLSFLFSSIFNHIIILVMFNFHLFIDSCNLFFIIYFNRNACKNNHDHKMYQYIAPSINIFFIRAKANIPRHDCTFYMKKVKIEPKNNIKCYCISALLLFRGAAGVDTGAVFSPKVGDYGPPFCSVLGCRTACSHTPSCPPLYVVTPDTALVTSSASFSLYNPFQNTF